MSEPDDPQEMSVRPGSQAGWTLPLYGDQRCFNYGHELDCLGEYTNGLFVGYCTRCSARVEMPWFRGGTIAALAEYMAAEAETLMRPSASVIADLEQVVGLLEDDLRMLKETRARLMRVQRAVVKRIAT